MKDRYDVLVGDAGRLTDPLTGEGILNGMISGRIAGNVIADCCGKGDLSADVLSHYDREIRRQLGRPSTGITGSRSTCARPATGSWTGPSGG